MNNTCNKGKGVMPLPLRLKNNKVSAGRISQPCQVSL